jgi:hypothetical protein
MKMKGIKMTKTLEELFAEVEEVGVEKVTQDLKDSNAMKYHEMAMSDDPFNAMRGRLEMATHEATDGFLASEISDDLSNIPYMFSALLEVAIGHVTKLDAIGVSLGFPELINEESMRCFGEDAVRLAEKTRKSITEQSPFPNKGDQS